MKIEDRKYVRFAYTFKDESGTVVYNTDAANPPWYIHGHGLIMPALEKALTGHSAGDEFDLTLSATEAFGEYLEELVRKVDKKDLPEDFEPEIGAVLQGYDKQGNILPAVVVGLEDDKVVMDWNHPLAGRELSCTIKVLEVREPNTEEKGEVAQFLGNRPGMSTNVEQDGSIIMEFGSDDDEAASEQSFTITSGGCSGCCSGCGSPDTNDGNCSGSDK